jgi:tetrahydromethanopterin S-methyltransferase subunit C
VGDVFALLAAGVACLLALTAHLIRQDHRYGSAAAVGTRGWLLLATGTLAIVCGAVLFWLRLFSS